MDAEGAGNAPGAPEGEYLSQATMPMAATTHVAMTHRRAAFRSEILSLYVARDRTAKSWLCMQRPDGLPLLREEQPINGFRERIPTIDGCGFTEF